VSLAPDLPPITAGEELYITFDFAPELAIGETVASVSSVTCTLVAGSDLHPSDRTIDDPVVSPSPNTSIADCAVRQLIGGMVSGTRYRLQSLVATSANQTLSIETHIDCN
jgi:hypothetical protein